MDDRVHPDTATILVRRLVDHLQGRGLPAEPVGANMVWIAGRALHRHALARMSPAVLCRTDAEGHLGWWWVKTTRDGNAKHEWICPAMEITTAADAIVRALPPRPAPTDQRATR
jgi:hypothetical protein